MIDTLRSDFPADMSRAASHPGIGVVDSMAHDVLDRLRDYARDHATSFGLWAFGVGFVLGWKLKPW